MWSVCWVRSREDSTSSNDGKHEDTIVDLETIGDVSIKSTDSCRLILIFTEPTSLNE